MITEVHQEVRSYRMSTSRAAHFENINQTTEDWCISEHMEEGDYLMMDSACEVIEKGTREKKDGTDALEEKTRPLLDLDSSEEALRYAEEDWENSELIEVPKDMELDLPFSR